MTLLSRVRLGLHLGFKLPVRVPTINELTVFAQPAHIQNLSGREIPPQERDVFRADLVRRTLSHP